MTTPALPLCLAFVAGILLPLIMPLAVGIAVAASALGGALWCSRRGHLVFGTACLVLAFAVVGNVAAWLHARAVNDSELGLVYARLGEPAFASPCLVTGRLRSEPVARFDATVLTVDVDTVLVARRELAAAGGLRVSVRGERRESLEAMNAGDRIRFWSVVRQPSFFNNPGGFDGAGNLERQHVDLFGSVKSGLLVTRLESSASVSMLMSRLRREVHDRLASELGSRKEMGVVAALVTGVRTELSPELTRLYQRAGIFHVMAISGAHVAIWIACLYRAFRWLGWSTRASLVCLVLILPLYAVFCGSRPPVVRAVLMALVLIGARLLSLRAPSANALALAALALLAWEPASLYDAGFQLTMAAMSTIVVFYQRFAEWLTPLGLLAKPFAVSFAAQLGVMPVAAWHFHRLSPGAPLASLAAIPLAAAICVLGVALVLVAGIPVAASIVSAATRVAVGSLTVVAGLFAELPAASVRVGAPSWVLLLLYAVGLAALVSSSRRLRVSGGVLLVAVLASMTFSLRSAPGTLDVRALDVGHGDALLLTLPDGGNVLVDGGGLPFASFDIGESVVLPVLLDRGIRRLDAVVVTHADFDHIGGLATVVDELRVDAIWQGSPEWERGAYRELRERARERGVPVRSLAAGERFELGGVQFEVLAAGEGSSEASNDRSVVLRLGYAGRHVLLTGDAEAELERRLVRSGMELRADVLKLAHHGSRSSTSNAFLDAVQPSFAIISARSHRSRPIPSAVVLERLRERAIAYARTDRNGTITVRIHPDGDIEVSTYR